MSMRGLTVSVVLIPAGVIVAAAWLSLWWPGGRAELPTVMRSHTEGPQPSEADEIPWERRMARYGPFPHYEAPPPPPEGADEVASEQRWASCGRLPDSIAITLVGGSLDYLPTMRFTDAMKGAIRNAPPLYLADLAPCGLVVYTIGANARSYAGTIDPDPLFGAVDPQDPPTRRTMMSYRVNVYQEGGPFLGSFVGSCWFDEAETCGKAAAADVLAAVLKYRSW